MSYKWSVEKTKQFLEAFEKHPCLWSMKDKSYKNREQRYKAYSAVARAMNIVDFGPLDVRTRVRSIRNAYTLELVKIQKSRRPGADADQLHRPRVPWFHIADRVFGNGAHTTSNDICLRSSEESNIANLSRIRKQEDDDDDLTDCASNRSPSLLQDEFDIFGAFVASELRELKNSMASRTLKRKIQSAILEAYEPVIRPCQSPNITPSSSTHHRCSDVDTNDSVNINESRSDETFNMTP